MVSLLFLSNFYRIFNNSARRVFLFCLCLASFTASTGSYAAETENAELDTINLELKWKHAFQFAGYYAALEKGFYQEVGLNVLFHENDETKQPIKALLDGSVDYAITGSEVVVYRGNGDPVVVLGAIFQHSPNAFLVTEESGIQAAEDFRGQRMMLLSGIQNAELLATLRQVGIGEDDYTLIQNNFDAFSLVRGEADVFAAYVSDQGFSLDEAGIENRFILPEHYGIDFYSDVLVTSENEIASNPQRAQDFLQASLLGWDYALNHPDEIIELILEKYNTQNLTRAHLEYEADISRELIHPLLVRIGYTNTARWDHIKNVFIDLGFLDAGSNTEGLVYQDQGEALSNMQWLTKNWYFLAGLAIALFITALGVFTIQLRRQVNNRTQALKSSEQNWLALINAVPACVKTLNINGELLSINQTGMEMLNAKSQEQVCGLQILDVVDESYHQAYRELLAKVFKGESATLLFKGKSIAGKEVWFETHAVPFPDLEGKITRLLGVTQDVSERVGSGKEKEILHNELQAARKMEALGHLTGGIAHDFNNLLAIIIGYTGLAKLEKDNGTGSNSSLFEYIDSIENAGERAKVLIDQMLIFSRGDDAEKIPVKLNELIAEDLSILSAALPSSIKIEAEISEDLPIVSLNPGQFNQILMNLSINARDAMSGKGTLSIRLDLMKNIHNTCSACRKGIFNDWVQLSISDTGSGIDAITLEKIFDPFFTTKNVGEGSGMGLAVVYGIIHKNGGHILVETESTIGTTFKVLFPPFTNSNVIPLVHNNENTVLPKGSNEPILIIDDEESYGEFVKTLLLKNGYQPTFVSDSKKALHLFENNPELFALIITDQTMPEVTGIEIVSRVRQLMPDFPIIICSGYSEHFDRNRAEELKVGYIAKPVDTGKLLNIIHDTLALTVKANMS